MHEVKHVNFREKSHVDPVNNLASEIIARFIYSGANFSSKRTSGGCAIFPRAIAHADNSRVQIRKTNADIGGHTRFTVREKE